MAKARKIVDQQPDVELVLTAAEASFLLEVMQFIGGPHDGPRKHAEAIDAALSRAGVQRPVLVKRAEGSIYF